MSNEPNEKYLMPLSKYQANIMKQIDEAYWYENTENVGLLETQLDDVNDMLDKGHTWYPTF